MTTRYDILAAKYDWEAHMASHRCSRVPCADRLALWTAYQRTGSLWGQEPGDLERQREQFTQQNSVNHRT